MKTSAPYGHPCRPGKDLPRRGFTRIEALFLVAGIGLLVTLQAPLTAQSGGGARTAACHANFRRLIQGWQMYTDDHRGVLPPSHHGGAAQAGNRSWVTGWLDWTTAGANTNLLFLTDDRYSHLACYVDRDPGVFKCPADTFLAPQQVARGWNQRVRSVVASLYVGEGNVAAGPTSPIYQQVRRQEELHIPGPSATWVHTEEHPDSINDPGLFPPRETEWIDIPAAFHDGGAVFTFADGHLETRFWESTTTLIPVRYSFFSPRVTRGDPDIHWVSFRTPRNRETSY